MTDCGCKNKIIFLAPLLVLGLGFYQPPPAPLADVDVWSVVRSSSSDLRLEPGRFDGALAWGSFADLINQTGWAVLDIHTNADAEGSAQSRAAGFLEGALTHSRMSNQLQNIWGIDFPNFPVGLIPEESSFYLHQNEAWLRSQVQAYPEDAYWMQVGFLLEQLQGLTEGYNAYRSTDEPRLSKQQILMLSVIDADMDSVQSFISARSQTFEEQLAASFKPKRNNGHCSVLVQIAPDTSDLWISHTTWDAYRTMLRMVKYLDMPLPKVASRRMAFTSYPGCLYSMDDFYTTDAGLTVVETTLDNYNQSLWAEFGSEKTAMTWLRSMVANRLATSGDAWTEIALRHQSGTCNNQWMVLDNKRFEPHQPLREGLLWISETMPGFGLRKDVTSILAANKSWPSYNVPYFNEVRQRAGYHLMQQLYPDRAIEYSFDSCPRAQMFARAQAEDWVQSLSSFMKLMRYNRAHDPLSQGDRCNGISARCDLNPEASAGYDCFGAQDAKVTSWRRDPKNLSFLAVLSPTFDTARPFRWSEQRSQVEGCKASQHLGHPDLFTFEWYAFPSSLPGLAEVADQAHQTTLHTRSWMSHSPSILIAGIAILASTAGILTAAVTVGRMRRHAQPDVYQALPA